ncbi:MAG TPA: PSD1 and planctomycete cytochrome C domain-containing protein [Planctomycetota bacterium]|nr:PSD1 and planctomycete cytochrome C domain-containing protein [Planctomycetota bacterium]
MTLAILLLLVQADDREGIAFFETKIRPVLVEHCYKCHAAEAKKVKAGLYVDTRDGLLKGGDTGPSVVPGDLEKSLLYKALTWEDENLQMPPKNRLPKEVVADFAAWIRRGAPDPRTGKAVAKAGIDIEKGRQYWAVRPLAPVDGTIDALLEAKLARAGVKAVGPAERRTLIRRATLLVTGLPPTPEEIDAFVNDRAPGAWERVVDRLLASPAYGERWARFWLDAARFGESHGFEQDYDREGAYHYRDFVVRALNDDLPYDRFVQWQVAGDELAPDEPLAWMATGFLGAGPFPTQLTEAEFESARYDELDSMGSTVGSAILGLSVGCARCHDHKFDPLPQRDYYRLIATFTTAIRSHVELDLDPAATRAETERWAAARAPLAAALEAYEREELPKRYAAWVAAKGWEKEPAAAWTVVPFEGTSKDGTTFTPLGDGSYRLGGGNPDRDRWTLKIRVPGPVAALRLEALPDDGLHKKGPGRADNGNFALSEIRAKGRKLVRPRATFEQNATTLSAASVLDNNPATGWAVDPQFGRAHALVVELDPPLDAPGELVVDLTFAVNARHTIGRPRLSVAAVPAAPDAPSRPAAEQAFLDAHREGRRPGPAGFAPFDPEGGRLRAALAAHDAAKPRGKLARVLVTSEGLKPLKHNADERGFPHFYKQTHFLARGDVNKKQDVVEPGFLQIATRADESRWRTKPPAGARTPGRRTELARWLTDVEHGAGALTARVAVNRLWHHHFGRGIVATPNDFGTQGEPPTHPELLERLAGELVRGGWSLKRIHRLILTSAAYRRSSAVQPEALAKDPENALLWRWRPRRLEGEAIRDSALAVGGLLDRTMYGPGTLDEDMTRRSLYFFVKRSRLIPMMQLFDAPEPLVSVGSRPTTTIAPQALLFMNSPLVRRAAEGLAKRLPSDPEQAVVAAYQLALGRVPTPEEQAACVAYLKSGAPPARLAHVVLCLSEFIYVD